jgi:hypothetical protein
MQSRSLVGKEVAVVVNEPWDFFTAHGAGPFRAKVLQIGPDPDVPTEDAALLRLETPLIYDGVDCEYFIARRRHEDDRIDALLTGAEIHSGLTRIPADRANSENPFDLSWWRGGVGLIATLRKV